MVEVDTDTLVIAAAEGATRVGGIYADGHVCTVDAESGVGGWEGATAAAVEEVVCGDNDEAWLFKPENKKILERVQEKRLLFTPSADEDLNR